MCDYDYDDCDTLGTTWIVVIVVAVIFKVLFWSFVCYRWRRRNNYYTTRSVVVVQQANHTISRPGQQGRQPVTAQPVAPSHTATPHYPGTAQVPPAYNEAASKRYPSAPAGPSAPPPYGTTDDDAPLLP